MMCNAEFCQIVCVCDLLVSREVTLINWNQHSQEGMEMLLKKSLPIEKSWDGEKNRVGKRKKWGQASRWFKQFNSFVSYWQAKCFNIRRVQDICMPPVLEKKCYPSAWPQRLYLIKQWKKPGENYTFFLSSASCLIVVLVQFWNSISLFVLSRCDLLPQFGKVAF